MFHTAALALLLTAPTHAAPTTYDLDPEDGRLYVLVKVKRGGLLSGFGHDHVVVATGWSGTVTWDPEDLGACSVSIDVPVDGLRVDPGDARTWEGLDGTTPDGDKAKITANFRAEGQLYAAVFPTIRYRATSCAPAGDAVLVTGDLTIRGVSHEVAVPMTIQADGERFAATGRFEARHTDFGFSPFRAFAGALKNDDTLTFVVDVRGNRR